MAFNAIQACPVQATISNCIGSFINFCFYNSKSSWASKAPISERLPSFNQSGHLSTPGAKRQRILQMPQIRQYIWL